ncbi:MAG: ribose-phosphate diphosphokinase [Oscillospiraceae bacterium]|nr:ribose-phosphate diphosphokinase [Oscillospiraceae bacterium]
MSAQNNQPLTDQTQSLIHRGSAYTDYNPSGLITAKTAGPVGLVTLPGSCEFVEAVNRHLFKRRMDYLNDGNWTHLEEGLIRDSYIIPTSSVRFSSGEGKGQFDASVRGHDLFIYCDVTNYSVHFELFGHDVPMGPDDHFQDLIRIILAATGKANRINVIMPFLYEVRQNIRSGRESLDCAYMLKELSGLGVDNIITFDPHDPRIDNSLPAKSVESIPVSYRLIESFLKHYPDIRLEGDKSLMIVSPDELGMKRAMFYASIMELPFTTFYRQREVNIKNDRAQGEVVDFLFLGDSPEGRDVVIIDDMIVTGFSMVETAKRLKAMKARRVFCLCSFPLFVDGIEKMRQACEQGLIDHIFGTNLIYRRPELLASDWYTDVDLAYFCALLTDAINHNVSISKLINQSEEIKRLINEHKDVQQFMKLAD